MPSYVLSFLRGACDRCRTVLLGLIALTALADASAAKSPYYVVHSRAVATHVEAYAQVQPIALVPIKAPASGIVSALSALPGASVGAGEKVASLAGADVDAARARAEAAVKSATARLAAAEKTLEVLRSQLASHLSTQEQVAQAQAEVAAATGAVATGKAELQTAQLAASIEAPVAGTIVALNAATGERVAAGDTLLTIQPTNRVWVTAVFYGVDAAAVHLGDKGTFKPTSGKSFAVEAVSVAPTSGGAGDVTVGFRAVQPNPGWRTGEFGQVVLEGPEESFVAVPTTALILDQGKWWVLVHTPQGDKPTEVVPGPSRNWQTFLRAGIASGTEIVAQNAYLEYHRQIASRYQPPD